LTTRDIGALGLRLVGLWQIVVAISTLDVLAYLLYALCNNTEPTNFTLLPLLVYGAPPALHAGLGILLLIYGEKLATMFFGTTDVGPIVITAKELQAVAFSVAGVLVFFSGVLDIPQIVATCITTAPTGSSYGRTVWGHSAQAILRLSFGVVLFLNAQGISSLWRSCRIFGHPQPPTNQV